MFGTDFYSLIGILHFFRIKNAILSKKHLLYQSLSTVCWEAKEHLATTAALRGDNLQLAEGPSRRGIGNGDTLDNLANHHYILVRLS